VASEEILADEGVVVTGGWEGLRYMKIAAVEQGGVRRYNTLPLSSHAVEKAMQLADYYDVFLMRGRFATVSTCSGTLQHGEELSQRWNAIIENMEGAAVAQICLRCGVDCLEIRGVSNMVEERDLKKWNIPLAVDAAQRFVLKYLKEMDRPENTPVTKAVPEM